MKINAIRAFIIASLVIILLYALGLFLPIILNSTSIKSYENNLVLKSSKKNTVSKPVILIIVLVLLLSFYSCNKDRARVRKKDIEAQKTLTRYLYWSKNINHSL